MERCDWNVDSFIKYFESRAEQYFDPEILKFVKPQLTMFKIHKRRMKGGWSGFSKIKEQFLKNFKLLSNEENWNKFRIKKERK